MALTDNDISELRLMLREEVRDSTKTTALALERLSDRLETMGTKLSFLDSTLDGLRQEASGVRVATNSIRTDLTSLRRELDGFRSTTLEHLDGIAKNIETVQQEELSTNRAVADLEGRIGELEKRVA